MKSPVFHLLQNEGALMQGCFKSSLSTLRTGRSGDRGRFYAASFNFAIGVERLLKLLLMLDHWSGFQHFPSTQELKGYGHDIERLHASVLLLFPQYNVLWPSGFEPDDLDRDLLRFFSDFARSSRYFNLDVLAGGALGTDPLVRWSALISRVYEADVPEMKRVHNEEQLDAMVKMIEPNVFSFPGDQSFRETVQDHSKIALALPAMCLRLLKLLVPLKELMISIREQIHRRDHEAGRNWDVPFMEEFLDFVCRDKTIISEAPEDWP
jgi:hypothetical protein